MKICSMCEKPARARGLCKNHYYQLRERGELAAHPITLGTRPLKERLLEKVLKTPAGCWEWTSQCNDYGYGLLWHNGAAKRAHRISYELFHGPLSVGEVVCHKCDNPKCVNPEHLFKGTRLENNRDAKAKGRNAKGERDGRAQLSDSAIQLIRLGDHLPAIELAKMFGVHPSHISRIRSGKRRAG